MPTEPLQGILYREFSRVTAKNLISIASPLLQELVNYATNVLSRSEASASGEVDVDLAALALFRHIIEMTDGIEVLVSQCCAMPAIPLLRSSFESLLSLEYLFETKVDYKKRALSWFVGYARQRLASYERLDASTTRGLQAKKDYQDDRVYPKIQAIPAATVQEAIKNMKALLAKPHLQPIEQEYERLKNAQWFHLYGGPAKLEQLARRLKRLALYDMLYRPWSRLTHAQDLAPFLRGTKTGKPAIGQLRHPDQLRQVAGLAASMQLDGIRKMLNWFRPGEDPKRWYIEEVQATYNQLCKVAT